MFQTAAGFRPDRRPRQPCQVRSSSWTGFAADQERMLEDPERFERPTF